MTVLRRHLVPAALFVLLPAASHAVEGRAFWLTRWNARDQNSIASTIQGMQLLKANTLFIQVFGDGMALHDSDRAPRSPLVAGNFDALQAAITEGRRRNVEVHAYINVCNVYSGGLAAPASASHLVRAHPEWAVAAESGRPGRSDRFADDGKRACGIFLAPLESQDGNTETMRDSNRWRLAIAFNKQGFGSKIGQVETEIV